MERLFANPLHYTNPLRTAWKPNAFICGDCLQNRKYLLYFGRLLINRQILWSNQRKSPEIVANLVKTIQG